VGGYRVEGSHYSYNPLTLVTQPLGKSLARNCNVTQWCFEWR
jgi:hypothetical protein